jgi:hypothetical protein
MLSLRNRFGIPGVISVIALVFAMLGGAYAASQNGGGKATASAKKGKRGPRGPKGATGPAGPAGPQGLAGAKGDAGAAGKDGGQGIQGSQGLPGKSVEVANYSGPECAGSEEGATVQVAGEPSTKKYVCDGTEGAQGSPGTPGSPWTAGGTLPVGSTETGAWGAAGSGPHFTALPFSIPLAAPLDESHVHYITESSSAAEKVPCENASHPGTASITNPEATSGNLCVYLGEEHEAFVSVINPPSSPSTQGADTSGAVMAVIGTAAASYATGTWAVTG